MAADWAQIMYDTTLADLRAGKNADAAKAAGAMAHYISDVAVFGHVMGKSTAWAPRYTIVTMKTTLMITRAIIRAALLVILLMTAT